MYLTVDPTFQSLWFLPGFLYRVAANKKATETNVPSD